MPLKYDQIAEVEVIARRIANEEIARVKTPQKKTKKAAPVIEPKVESMKKEVMKNARIL